MEMRKEPRSPIDTNHSIGMSPFQSVPNDLRRLVRCQLMVCVPFFVSIGLALLIFWIKPDWNSSWAGFVLIVAAVGIGAILSLRASWTISRNYMGWQMARDRRDLGSARDGETYLGVAYSPTVVTYRLDTSWDRGYARIEDSCLAFRGYGPSFLLPISRIESVEVIKGDLMTMNLPRIKLTYQDESGQPRGLLFEVCDAPTRAAMSHRTTDIAKWLQNSQAAYPVVKEAPPAWPFNADNAKQILNPAWTRATRTEKVVAAICAAGIYLILMILVIVIFNKSAGMFITVPLFSGFAAYIRRLTKVVRGREKTPEPTRADN